MPNRFQRVFIGAGMAIVGAIAGFVYRGVVDGRDVADSAALVIQSRTETRDSRAALAAANVQIATLKLQLTNAQAALDSVMPSENTYTLAPNRSVSIAGGRLSVALVGSPTNDEINLNINGKRYVASAGQQLKIADASTDCDVRVKSFDMFKALVMATCQSEK